MTLLDEIRKRDEHYGDHLPDHYQAQLDRRNLLKMLEDQDNQIEKMKGELEKLHKSHSHAWNRGLVSGIGYAQRVQNDVDTWEPKDPYSR